MKKRSTLKHIAESLNLSVSTVSRVLNGRGEFSEETKSSVFKVAKMLDYRAHTIAISLRKKTLNKVIGVILPEVKHYFFSSILDGIISNSHKQGYTVMIGESLHNPKLETELINKYLDYFVSGIIFSPSREKDSIINLDLLQKEELPYVIIDRTYKKSNRGSLVKHDDYMGAFNAVEYLIEQGYTRIALIKGDDHCSISSGRAKGYFDALKKHGISHNSSLVRSSTHANKKEGYELFKEMYLHIKPDAVFTITDYLATGVYEFAQENQIGIPQDLAIIGYSNSDIAEILHPKLTSVEQNGSIMGETAFEYLINQVNDSTFKKNRTFDSELIVRQSSQKKNALPV